MSAKFKTTFREQPGVFYLLLAVMLFFYVIHMITSGLVVFGYVSTQIGGDVSLQTFRELLLVAMMVFRAEGRSIVERLLPSNPAAPAIGGAAAPAEPAE